MAHLVPRLGPFGQDQRSLTDGAAGLIGLGGPQPLPLPLQPKGEAGSVVAVEQPIRLDPVGYPDVAGAAGTEDLAHRFGEAQKALQLSPVETDHYLLPHPDGGGGPSSPGELLHLP